MVILLLLGITLTGAAVALAARAASLGAVRREETFAQISAYGFSQRIMQRELAAPGGLRVWLNRLAKVVGAAAMRSLGSEGYERDLRTLLRTAGLYRTEPATYLGYRVLAATGIPFLLLLLQGPNGISVRAFMLLVVAGGMGWVLPSFFVKRRAARRIAEIDLETPELVDLLVTTVEAGVGFTAALQLVSRRVEGPLGQELRITLQEQNMGLTIEDSLQNMLLRVDSLSLRTFVQAIIQGQMLGVSIGKILRDLAIDMRKRRRQLAEERAQKAPVKMLFPLVFLILPAMMIVVLGGSVIGIGKILGDNL
jgi:tight adherence protein C